MISAATRDAVRRRAADRSGYCRLPQAAEPDARFHIEHIVARQYGGDDDEANLALACHRCNRHKGPNLSGIDPDSDHPAFLFHPRRENWDDHFRSTFRETIADIHAGRFPGPSHLVEMKAPFLDKATRWCVQFTEKRSELYAKARD